MEKVEKALQSAKRALEEAERVLDGVRLDLPDYGETERLLAFVRQEPRVAGEALLSVEEAAELVLRVLGIHSALETLTHQLAEDHEESALAKALDKAESGLEDVENDRCELTEELEELQGGVALRAGVYLEAVSRFLEAVDAGQDPRAVTDSFELREAVRADDEAKYYPRAWPPARAPFRGARRAPVREDG